MRILVGQCERKECQIALYERHGGILEHEDMSYVTKDGKRCCLPCYLHHIATEIHNGTKN